MNDLRPLIANVQDEESLLALLGKGLGWPIKEFGAATRRQPQIAEGVNFAGGEVTVRRLRPLDSEDKRPVFLVDFGEDRYLRRDLRALLRSLRAYEKGSAEVGASGVNDTLFVVAQNCWEDVRFVLFRPRRSGQPEIRSFGWDDRNAPRRTVLTHNLVGLHWNKRDRWQDAFNVEGLTEEFYTAFEETFKQVHSLSIHPADIPKKNAKDQTSWAFIQQLFNRLLFVAFVDRMKWLQLPSDASSEHGYLAGLWDRHRRLRGNYRHYGLKDAETPTTFLGLLGLLFHKGLDSEGGISEGHALFPLLGKVEYLNGGLFATDAELEVNGATVSDDAFEFVVGENGLFRRYNFTVTESTPLDQEVAVDPEMLGKVFERLVNDRHDEGKYYTPRPIVSFMVDEALKSFLVEGGVSPEKASLLVDQERLRDPDTNIHLDAEEVRPIREQLFAVRAVDPACGSGAYLLGLLQKIFSLVDLLNLGDKSPRDLYRTKLRILQECIFGVDLDETAVRIARLRLWLSLAVENPTGAVPEPLPNLDFRIESGDSLAAPIAPKQPSLERSAAVAEFHQAKLAFGNASPAVRSKLSNRITDLREEVRRLSHEEDAAFRDSKHPFDWQVEFAEVFEGGLDSGRASGANGFDIVLANPPYGEGNVSEALRTRTFGQNSGQAKDIYAFFMMRALELLRSGGSMVYIVSNTWRTIRTHSPLRRELLGKGEIISLVDLPEWVFDKVVVRTTILNMKRCTPREAHHLMVGDLQALPKGDWARLEVNLHAIASKSPDVQTHEYARYRYPQAQIQLDPEVAFFIALPSLQRFFNRDRFRQLGVGHHKVADVVQGLATADNDFYLRVGPGTRGSYQIVDQSQILSDIEISTFSQDEKLNGVDPTSRGGRMIIPYDKGGASDIEGGWLPCYEVPTQYYIDWSKESVSRLRTATIADRKIRKGELDKIKEGDDKKIASRFQNSPFYFKEGITFSRTGRYAPTFRRSSGTVFDTEGSCIFSDSMDRNALLGILNSSLIRFLIKVFVNNGWHAEIEDVKRTPIVENQEILERIGSLVGRIVEKQKTNPKYGYWTEEGAEIDKEVYTLYELDDKEIRDVRLWQCRQEGGRLARARGWIDQVKTEYKDHLSRADKILSIEPKYWTSHPLLKLIAGGEGQHLEFKETLSWDVKDGRRNDLLHHEVYKTVAAFMNTRGGELLIGVTDEGLVVGLDRDFSLLSKADKQDEFERKLRDLVAKNIEPPPRDLVQMTFDHLAEGTVCRLHITPRSGRNYVPTKDARSGLIIHEVWIREGNRSVRLDGKERDDWISARN